MAWLPIAQTVPQYVDGNGDPYSGAVLKFYEDGTTTNTSMATDDTGGTTLTSVALDSNGYPSNGGSVFIPHIDQKYKLSLYPTQAAADSDSGAIWTIDNLTAPVISAAGTDESVKVSSNDTTAGYLNGKLIVGNNISLTEGSDGGNETLAIALNIDTDTAAGQQANAGYTAAEGLILTGQGSTNDITLKNDADADVLTVPTGTTTVEIPGTLAVEAYSEDADQYTATTGTRDLDVSLATYFYPSADLGTASITFTFSNPAASGRVSSFTLELLGANDATLTWPASVDWPSGVEPSWSAGVDVVTFITRDGGTTWLGFLGGLNLS